MRWRRARLATIIMILSIRPGERGDQAAILALAERLGAFGPTTRSAQEIAARERRALADALERPSPGSALLVAHQRDRGLVGVLLLETRRDYFTAEGQGVGQALLDEADEWGRRRGFRRLTLAVFADNARAKGFYARLGWRTELETLFKTL